MTLGLTRSGVLNQLEKMEFFNWKE